MASLSGFSFNKKPLAISGTTTSSRRKPVEGGTLSGGSYSFAPSTPPLRSAEYVPSFQPKPIPTFSMKDFMPTDTLKQMERILSASPKVNEKQLQQRARTQTELLTNPQIEALRNQINAFKSLIPKAVRDIDSAYAASRGQAERSVQDVLKEAVQAAQSQPGGMRSGVATELSAQAQRDASPLLRALFTDYENTKSQVIGTLESQKSEAENLLKSIQNNRKNMTKANYNALRDQAIKQFRQAQQAQQRFLQGIAQIESGARQSAASYQQESAAAYNQFMQQMAQQQAELAQQQMQELASSNLDSWTRFLTGTNVQNRSDALRLLNQYRPQIQSSVGQDGYQQLQKYINQLGASWMNPNYVAPFSIGASAGVISNTNLGSMPMSEYMLRRFGSRPGYYIPPEVSTTLGP